MAIDKNSKAYNSLLNKGYTDEQITQMYDTASKQGTTKWVVPTTYDPMADLTPEYIANMDMNKQIRGANQSFSQYWDDSSRDKQDTRWWLNQKYTWEGVKTSDINYNPDITTKDLNPNFVYWKQSQVYGTDHPWYISQRNDDIASALYNEWLTSREDVTRFLMAQNWFTNSSEEDRLNTIESVWKRLWAIAEMNREKPDPSKADEILTDTSGKLYGKVTADEGNPKEWIDTLSDANSVFRMREEARVENLKAFIAMNPADIAELMVSWKSPFSDQTIRDAKQYYPEFMAEVEVEKKKKLWQQNVNAMTSWNYSYVISEMEAKKGNIESSIDAMSKEYASNAEQAESTKQDIENSVATNQTASEASKTMEAIEKEAAQLKNRLKNLRQEANAAFKWDVPDYLVNAYINNKSQEIQNQLSVLEDRYNAAYQRYTTELDQEWKDKQYKLQKRQLDLQEKQQNFNQWYQKQTLEQSKNNYVTDDDGNVWKLNINEDWTVYYEKVEKIQSYSWSWMKWAWLRNNNPWNIKDNDFWNVIWHDERWFAKFATPEDWFDALVEKIKYNQTNPNSRYYWDTILEYFEKYAPSSDWNKPLAYANEVARQLWVSINTPISQLDPVKFAAAIAKHDSGYDYSTYWQFRWNAWTDTNTSNNASTVDINSIDVPDSIYVIEDEQRKQSRRVDPNSEEGKKLRQEYINNYIKENWLTTSSWAMKTITLDSGEVYQMPMDFYRYIYNPIPTRQKDSDQDKRDIITDILELYRQGYSAADAFLVYNWVDLNSTYADTARTLINYLMWAWKDIDEWLYSSMVYTLSNGDIEHAITAVENFALPDDAKADIIDIVALTEKISDFIEMTNDSKYSKYFWPYDSPINTWIWKKAGNEEAMKAYADLWNIYADIRQKLMGNAMTEHEAETYAPILAETSENLNTIIQKLTSTLQNQLAKYNAIRWQYWLPRLDLKDPDLVNMVLNVKDREKLYEWGNNY